MKDQVQKEARYIKSALKIKSRKKKPYEDNHIILRSNSNYCSTWTIRYLNKKNEHSMQDLEEKSNNEYVPVQGSQGL